MIEHGLNSPSQALTKRVNHINLLTHTIRPFFAKMTTRSPICALRSLERPGQGRSSEEPSDVESFGTSSLRTPCGYLPRNLNEVRHYGIPHPLRRTRKPSTSLCYTLWRVLSRALFVRKNSMHVRTHQRDHPSNRTDTSPETMTLSEAIHQGKCRQCF